MSLVSDPASDSDLHSKMSALSWLDWRHLDVSCLTPASEDEGGRRSDPDLSLWERAKVAVKRVGDAKDPADKLGFFMEASRLVTEAITVGLEEVSCCCCCCVVVC